MCKEIVIFFPIVSSSSLLYEKILQDILNISLLENFDKQISQFERKSWECV